MATLLKECLECPARPVCIKDACGGADCREVARLANVRAKLEESQPQAVQQIRVKIVAYYTELNNITNRDGILIADVMAKLRQLLVV
jgi:hypothetical protein